MMFTKKNNPYSGLVLILTVLTFSFFAGCGKQEAPKQEEQAAETVKTAVDTTPEPVAEPPKVEEKTVPDLLGIYTGKFDSRATTLKITEQTDSKFSGSITINYRETINQKISGELDQEKMTVTMKDMLHLK